MANINIQFTPQTGYTGEYRAVAYKLSAPNIAINQVDIQPPFNSPQFVSLSVPTLEPYKVEVIAKDCNKVVSLFNTSPAGTCTNIAFPVGASLPNAVRTVPYSHVILLEGTHPFLIWDVTGQPSWMTISVQGNMLLFKGTPHEAGSVSIYIRIKNCSEAGDANTTLGFTVSHP